MYNIKFEIGYPARLEKDGRDITIYYNDQQSLIHELAHLYKGITFNKAFLGLSFKVTGRKRWYRIVIIANAIMDYYIYKQTESIESWRKLCRKILKTKKKVTELEHVIKEIPSIHVTEAIEKGLRVVGYKVKVTNEKVKEV